MASTATNKQPLLVDRVLHEIVDLKNATVPFDSGVEVKSENSAVLVVNAVSSDGCVIEDVYAISRACVDEDNFVSDSPVGYFVNLYLSSASDYLRPQQGIFVATFLASPILAERVHLLEMPYITAPVPQSGSVDATMPGQFQSLYVPKGRSLWAAVSKKNANDLGDEAPILGVQGGWY
tara:strand:+ start:71 stop:604 length:534 start_codon:yes stop_codon:yes gene_type:complete